MEYEKEIAIMARALNDEQIENILPGYKNIYKQIKSMRNYAELYYCKYIDTRDSYVYRCKNKEYSNITMNNVFSILGKRGAGKSSILLTLKNNIEENKHLKAVKGKEYKNNVDIVLPIILPIILPETMRNKGDMMGWILGCFKEIVDELSKVEAEKYNKEKNNGVNFGNCRKDEENTEVRKKYNEVLKQYSYTRKDYADIIKDNYTGLKEYIDKSRKILDPENELKRSFFEFINQLIKIKKESGTNKETPMIYMFLDDIDLTKNHCNEILGVISRYLCHPNIIVFVSGDYEIFETEQFMSYMKGNNLMELVVSPVENNIYGEKLFNENRMLARDALKKIMPPVYRYKLRSLSPEERLGFYYEKEQSDKNKDSEKENKKNLKHLLEEKFKDFNPDQSKKEHLEVINAYGLIFDEMPRGIMNVYCALNNMEDNSILKPSEECLDENGKKERDKKIADYISNFKNFINTIINSSSVLSKYEEEINSCIQINNPFTETFVNYERLIKQIERNNKVYYKEEFRKNEENDSLNDDMIVVLIFAHFIESIVQLVNPNRKVHGQKQVWELVDKKDTLGDRNEDLKENNNKEKKFKIYPHIKDTAIIFNLYESMLSNDALNIMPTMENLYLKDFSLKFYFNEMEKIEKLKKERIKDILPSIAVEDRAWMEEKFKIIYYHKDPLCMMFNKVIDEILNILKNKGVFDNDDKAKKDDLNENTYCKKVKGKFDIEFYNELISEAKGLSDEKKINRMQEKSNTISKESVYDFDQKLGNYIEQLLSDINKEHLNNDEKLEDIVIDIEYKVLNELEKISSSRSKDEIKYFDYFEQWHQYLDRTDVYKKWCDSRKDISPLTLILENDKDV
ncbi:MAG: hypothetical protein KHZ09_09155 [Clostridium sp.]|uniref:hypothetical protein n=1 Tax=Clostridium sp. TaxID=1506 RepID=UPI001DFBD591|nr:hypothetical protein [Clostridium sp.]MBS5125604.1 hypothetical protein [Clostridium sp.]